MELQKIPKRNQARNAITMKKSTVTMVDKVLPMVALMLPEPSSSTTSFSSSLILRASAKSCSIESSNGFDGDEEEIGDVSELELLLDEVLVGAGGVEVEEAATGATPNTSRTS